MDQNMLPAEAKSVFPGWFASYAIPDLLVTVFVSIIFVILSFTEKVNPLHVPSDDSLSSYPLAAKSTVNDEWLYTISVGIPFILFMVIFVIKKICKGSSSFIRDINIFAAVWIMVSNQLIIQIVTEIFKIYVGRARPDMYSKCGKDAQYADCIAKMASKAMLEDEFKSFPSGHSSTAMGGLYICVLFFKKAVTVHNSLSGCFALLFVVLAFYIGATRIRDFKHHVDDVIAGLFLGYIITEVMWSFSYNRIFPEKTQNQHENDDSAYPSSA